MRTEFNMALFCALVFHFSMPSLAADYKNEYEKKVKAAQDVGVLGDGLAGDSINFLNGATSFSATDISLPGNNGLSVALSRKYSVDFRHVGGAFGDWDLDIPYLGTTMTETGGWVIDSTTPLNRCSVVGQVKTGGAAATGAPPSVMVTQEGGYHQHGFSAWQYWHGYSLHLPGGDQTLLVAPASITQRPSTGGPYHWTTNQDWWFSCLPANANTGGGEGFLARAPDGTKYWFDWLGARIGEDVQATDSLDVNGGPPFYDYVLSRSEYRLLPTRIEDRFGNWVQYSWSTGARLNSITASDGRTITLTYAGAYVSSVTDGTRTWTYSYSNGSLTQVTLPDGSSWQYGLAALFYVDRPAVECMTPDAPLASWACYGGGAFTPVPPIAAYVIHPSGARVDFTFEQHFQFSHSADFHGYNPLSIKDKTISGPGLTAATWKYAFAPDVTATTTACQGGNCPVRVITDQIDPDNRVTRRIFGASATDESLLLGELHGHTSASVTAAGTPAITSSARWGTDILDDPSPITGTVPVFYTEADYRYVPSTDTVPYAVVVGTNPLPYGDLFTSNRRLPIKTRIQTQQGVTFTRTTNTFNEFAQSASVTRASAGLAGPTSAYSRSESTAYRHDLAKWVIGQATTVTDGTTGKVMSLTDYDAASSLPIRNYSFGVLQQTLAYNADGTLASVKDGRNNVIGLSNWYRGIPRAISYPTGVSQSAVVGNFGQISSTTDELASATGYGYDAMGRLSNIAYPSGDTVAWNATARGFVPVAAVEYGIPAGHWKQTVQTGTGKTTTFYDGRWSPVLTLTEDTALGASKSFVVRRFDAVGRAVFSSYPVALANVNDILPGIVTQYDALGRAYQVKQDSELGVLTTTTEYLSGFQTRVTNPRGYPTTTSYQVFDAPGTDAPVRIDAPQGVVTTITRDGFGKPLQVTRSGPGG